MLTCSDIYNVLLSTRIISQQCSSAVTLPSGPRFETRRRQRFVYASHVYNKTNMLVTRLWWKWSAGGRGGGGGDRYGMITPRITFPMAADTHPDYTTGAFVICFISPSITISHSKAVLSLDSTKELQTSIDLWNEACVVEKTPFYQAVYK
jgi:hypothetical protein